MAHFALAPGRASIAVTHRTVEEIWYFLSGHGEMWRKQGGREEVVSVEPGTCLTIPLGTHFQFRAHGNTHGNTDGHTHGDAPLTAVAVTMPPWPGEGEAIVVPGPWEPVPA